LCDKLIRDFGKTFLKEERNSPAFSEIVLREDPKRLK